MAIVTTTRASIVPRASIVLGPMAEMDLPESFFQLLKREKVRRRKYRTREDARRDVVEHIELFYTPKRKHTDNGMVSPVEFEETQLKLEKAGVWETKGTSNGACW